MGYLPIEDYGVIGDLYTVAFVAKTGSIDLMSFPYFDSPTIFAALLDDTKGGRFAIHPVEDGSSTRQLYLPDTNILLTRFLSSHGVAELLDFMPVETGAATHDIVRRVKVVRGEVKLRMLCAPRFDYARGRPETEQRDGTVWFRSRDGGGLVLRLRSTMNLETHGADATCDFALKSGESVDFVLDAPLGGADEGRLTAVEVTEALDRTTASWRSWAERCGYRGRWREMVTRSALTLKLLVSARDGSLVAAPSFAIPESLNANRNWDYRYTWIRDAAFTLRVLSGLGYYEEAEGFMGWISKRCTKATDGDAGPLRVLYRIDGGTNLSEEVLSHLEGYRRTPPVRVGNAASDQFQLDIYGELIDAIYLFSRRGFPIGYDLHQQLVQMLEWLARHWQEPDCGIWEIRGTHSQFLHSKVMCWVAFDRALRLANTHSLPAPTAAWKQTRDDIFRYIYENYWDDERGAFTAIPGSQALDAASLMMPFVHFVAPKDHRWARHLKAIEQQLVEDALVYRYRPELLPDGVDGAEGAFTMCSFWYVENLTRSGRVAEARLLFEKLHSYANHLGLYSEELGLTGEHLGNFPQAFTHLGLISAAMALSDAMQSSLDDAVREHAAAGDRPP